MVEPKPLCPVEGPVEVMQIRYVHEVINHPERKALSEIWSLERDEPAAPAVGDEITFGRIPTRVVAVRERDGWTAVDLGAKRTRDFRDLVAGLRDSGFECVPRSLSD
jgi:hypothetical protein